MNIHLFIPGVFKDVAAVDSGDAVDVCVVVVGRIDDVDIAVKHGNTYKLTIL